MTADTRSFIGLVALGICIGIVAATVTGGSMENWRWWLMVMVIVAVGVYVIDGRSNGDPAR